MLKVDNNIPYTGPNFKGLSIGPKMAGVLDKVGALKSPGQRLAFGIAAFTLHPIMDRLNPWIDDETKKTSAIRSAAKAAASTTTGVIIREACIVGTNTLLNNKNILSKLPEFMTKDKGHTSAVIGTLAGLSVMMFTNFLIDVPLTDKFTRLFTKLANKKAGKETKAPVPAFSDTFTKTVNPNAVGQLHLIKEKIDRGELPPMSQVNMEVIKCVS